jgi:hypothetical protein
VLNQRQVCCAETLAAYNFTIAYRKGSENARADALSRRTDYVSLKQERPRAILKQTNKGMQYNELLATIAIVEDTELESNLKDAYLADECASEGFIIYFKGSNLEHMRLLKTLSHPC